MDFDQNHEYKNFIRATLPEWEHLEDDEIEFERLSSLSNQVFLVTTKKDVNPTKFIFRKFSKQGVIDSDKESKVFEEMSKRGVGPKCYGGNEDYRLEEYFDARPIQNMEYNQPEVRRKLAISLANLHKINFKGVDKTSLFEKELNEPNYYKSFEDKCNQKIYSPEEQKMIDEIKTAADEEERAFIKNIVPKGEVVFSHNDLLSGNVLLTKESHKVILIDYEYAAYNFRGYDIGNMFKEATFDYSVQESPFFQVVEEYFPNDEELREFIRYYIAFGDLNEDDQAKYFEKFVYDVQAFEEYLQDRYKQEELQQRENKIFRETKIGVLLSHYYWMIWGIKMCKNKSTSFDYLTFSFTKYKYFRKLKAEILDLDASMQ